MDKPSLWAISPVDGRYGQQTAPLSSYFSEFGLIKYRVRIEVEYFIALCELPLSQLSDINPETFSQLRSIYLNFTESDAIMVKDTEKVTNHDVKAIEYFIKQKFDELGLSEHREFIHFGLTSQDINNTAIPLSLKEALSEYVFPALDDLLILIEKISKQWEDIPMLARTHGQPASPTRMGKELQVFHARLSQQSILLKNNIISAKFGGATGNFNAHIAAYPQIDWHNFATFFVEQTLGLSRSFPTTQIEHYDHLAGLCDAQKRINVILMDFCRDMWQYISMNYFTQKISKNEVGSSAMPHKVNPIDFENAEGNLGFANAIFAHLAGKLPISRLQRDLTDSTVLRNIGVPFAHTIIAFNSIKKGISKLEINREEIQADLDANWAVVAEGIQNILRREKYPSPYETLKTLTRTNESVTREVLIGFIDQLDISGEIKEEMKALTPTTYIGK